MFKAIFWEKMATLVFKDNIFLVALSSVSYYAAILGWLILTTQYKIRATAGNNLYMLLFLKITHKQGFKNERNRLLVEISKDIGSALNSRYIKVRLSSGLG
jgi:hypothetical protein